MSKVARAAKARGVKTIKQASIANARQYIGAKARGVDIFSQVVDLKQANIARTAAARATRLSTLQVKRGQSIFTGVVKQKQRQIKQTSPARQASSRQSQTKKARSVQLAQARQTKAKTQLTIKARAKTFAARQKRQKTAQIKIARRQNIARTGTIKAVKRGLAPRQFINVPAIGGSRQLAALSKQISKEALTVTKRGFLYSSNVVAVTYDQTNSLMFILFKGGAIYEYQEFPRDTYIAILQGNASAKTLDKSKAPPDYWPGKTPSVGAAVWKYIRKSGKWADGSTLYRRIN